jgi:hypothetical protein
MEIPRSGLQLGHLLLLVFLLMPSFVGITLAWVIVSDSGGRSEPPPLMQRIILALVILLIAGGIQALLIGIFY